MDNLGSEFENKSVLITGGLGSIGNQLAARISKFKIKRLLILDNRETEIFYKTLELDKADLIHVQYYLADIRDKERLMDLTENIDIIFHAAALKHVVLCEYNPIEAVKTNILGTQNIIECAIKNKIEKVILISTDKAVNPSNLMGATKLVAERLISAAATSKFNISTKFGIVRFGNVIASRGSVIEIWEKQIQNNEKITVTDPKMTRFFMTIPESVELVLKASTIVNKGEIFILKMPSVKIGDLANSYLKIKNIDQNEFLLTGKKPGEKLYEELILDSSLDFVLESNEMLILFPLTHKANELNKHLEVYFPFGFHKSENVRYSSNDPQNLLDLKQIYQNLKNILKP